MPIRCGGVEVVPGALVLGDDDGVLVASADQLDAAEAIHLSEEAVLASGGSLFAAMNFHEHRENLVNGTPSKLGFIG